MVPLLEWLYTLPFVRCVHGCAPLPTPHSPVQYLDNGASNWVVTNNVASNSSTAWGYFITGANNKPAGNDHVDHFWWVRHFIIPLLFLRERDEEPADPFWRVFV